MNRAWNWASVAVLAVIVSACATGPHTEGTMLSGSHQMPGVKVGNMSDRAMPSHSPDCTEAALANMPPEHRLLCEKTQGKPSNP